MSYLAPYCDDSGIHLPTYQDRLDDLIVGYKQIFGEDVYIEPDSYDYQLLSLISKCWDDMNGVLLDTYNARNPQYATGTALDTLIPIAGLVRRRATYSTCMLKFTGTPNAAIPAGQQAIDVNKNIWEVDSEFTLDANGVQTVNSRCTVAGAITAAIGEINTINTPITDLLTVTNESIAVTGNDTESDAQLRYRFHRAFMLTSSSVLEGIQSALASLSFVESVRVYENSTDSSVDGQDAHSIWVVIEYSEETGDTSDYENKIAEMIWKKKCPGVMTYCGSGENDREIEYTDVYGNEYTIKYSLPNKSLVDVTINMINLGTYDPDAMDPIVKKAVEDYINSLEIGEDLVVSTLYSVVFSAIASSSPVVSISSITAKIGSGEATSGILAASKNDMLRSGSITISFPGA